MPKLRLSAAARDDLREIRIYSKARFGVPVAREYLTGLSMTMALLGERPLIGANADDLAIGLRGMTYRSHRLFYRVASDRVEVIRILHHARDARREIVD